MARRRKLTRREFIQLSGLAVAGAVIASCKAPATEAPATEKPSEPEPTKKPEEPAAPASKFQEAPMLAKLVEAGNLPPVDERLPTNPWVAPMAEMVGKYGGGIRRGFTGVSDRWGPTKLIDRAWCWYDQNFVMQPRNFESWELSDDAKTWTFHMRKGMKWSDGVDLTAQDCVWYYENEAKNTTLSPSPPGLLSTRDENGNKVLCEMSSPDDYTVVYAFAHPKPMLLYSLGRDRNLARPGHHLKQYHIDLTDDKDALEKAVKDKGFGSWDELYSNMTAWFNNPELPQWGPWLAVNELANELFIMERNPYFMGVDPEGKQLPYWDKVTHRLYESNEVKNMWVVNGEIDFQARHMGIADYTLFKENEDGGDYQVYLGISAGHVAVQPNHTTKDPKLREFFQDRKVRIALSLAANRDEMNELVYDGLLTPRQYAPLSMSPNAYPKLANAYIEYDPDKANALLDEAGYTEKDSEGFRKWKDGSDTLSFIIEGTASPGSSGDDAAQLLVKYFSEVGIKAAYKYFERSLYEEHWHANEIEMAFWGGDRTVVPLAPGAPIFRGTMIDRPWACAWGLWFNSNGTDENGEEPPKGHWIWDIWDIWAKIEVEPDENKRNEMFTQILDIWAEELPMIGFLGETPAPIIVKNGIHNYLKGMPLDDTTGDEHLLNTETYFWEDPENHEL